MPTILRTGGGGDTLFPAGYEWKSTALGDVFPGWSADIIPICIDISTSKEWIVNFQSGQRWYTGPTVSQTINNGTAISSNTSLRVASTADGNIYGELSCDGYSVFLPFFYNFDFDAIKRDIRSGTCTVWLEKK